MKVRIIHNSSYQQVGQGLRIYFNSISERIQVYDNFNLEFRPTNERLLHWYGVETGGDVKYYFQGFDGLWYLIKNN